MFKNEDRKDYIDFVTQVNLIKDSKVLDMDSDGFVDIDLLPTIMALLGEPKCPPEKLASIREALIEELKEGTDDEDIDGAREGAKDGVREGYKEKMVEGQKRYLLPLDRFLTLIQNHLSNYGSQKEVDLSDSVHRSLQNFR
jgi:flagellar biosynthesis/type III secretory pathway protein FliH